MTDDPLIARLRACCVQVVGYTYGSGFFIAPNLVLTCAHVVGRASAEGASIRLLDWNGRECRPLSSATIYAVFPDDDVALLQTVEPGAAYAPLDGEVRHRDALYTIGFPHDRDVSRFEGSDAVYEGTSDSPDESQRIRDELKYTGGQIQAGFSGAPLLNLRTERVIGVVNATRDRLSNLGDWAIPSARVDNLLALRGIALPPTDPAWRDAERQHRDAPSHGKPELRQYRQDFHDLIADHSRWFTGRQSIIDDIRSFSSCHDCGYCRIEADAGLGKIALAVQVAIRFGAVAFFVSRHRGTTSPEQCLNHLSIELIDQYAIKRTQLPIGDIANTASMFLRTLEEAAVSSRDRIWVVVDALDEADPAVPGQNILFLPGSLPKGVFVVVTYRPGVYPLRLNAETPISNVLRITSDSTLQNQDVEEFLRTQVRQRPAVRDFLDRAGIDEEPFISRLKHASGGNFMYLIALASLVYRRIQLHGHAPRPAPTDPPRDIAPSSRARDLGLHWRLPERWKPDSGLQSDPTPHGIDRPQGVLGAHQEQRGRTGAPSR